MKVVKISFLLVAVSFMSLITSMWAEAQTSDGTVDSEQKISATAGGFGGTLVDGDDFGFSVASIGDLDGDGVTDLAVGAPGDDDGSFNRGAVWILFLNADGTVKSEQKASDTAGGFGGTLDDGDEFGTSVASIGDLDGDGVTDLAVGAPGDDDGSFNRGAVWILFLNADGTVKSEQKASDTAGGFGGTLDDGDEFGTSVASIGDLDGDGVTDLAVGAPGDDDNNEGLLFVDMGAVWILLLNSDGTVKLEQKISDTAGGFGGALDVRGSINFGSSVASIGDLDGDGVTDLAVGVALDDDGGSHPVNPSLSNRGAVWILFLNASGTVKLEQKISDTAGGFGGVLDDSALFGFSVASIGDLDGDGVTDLAVGAPTGRGTVWILFLNANGTVKSEQKISDTAGGFGGALVDLDFFGTSVASMGDLDGDGVTDLAVGAVGDNDGGDRSGAVWILLLQGNGTIPPPPGGDVFEPGDANADGFVNLADLGVIINAFRGTPAPGNGDCNGDTFTNLADLGCVIT
ncbi:integrin alpha, partial [Desulfobacterota bacterium AH_259_B03_O07]|nr:integrin alpha [Desulfobacterota bacterium AH_259_B03_O07]